jgi:hypothetical protein
MSDLLQRLIDRTREPLSAVRPILPSIYTPAEKTENAGGVISPAYLAPEPTAQPATVPTERADERGIQEIPPPATEEPIETRTSEVALTPPRSEADIPPHTSAPKPLSRLLPPDLKSTPPRKEPGIVPAPVTNNPRAQPEAISPPPPETKAVPRANEKPKGKATGPIYTSTTKTVMPPGLGSKNFLLANATKAAAMLRKISPVPADAASAARVENKAASSVFESDRSKTTSPLETSTAKAAIPPRQDQPGESPETPAKKDSGSTAAPSREHKDADIATPTNREAFAARQPERNSKKSFQDEDRAPPVEVHVSIGHIEVKAAQPNGPAPRRTSPRPRVTLDEFLKRPHYGGPL